MAALDAARTALHGAEKRLGAHEVASALRSFAARIVDLGKAEVGDKTMVDALVPFTEAFSRQVEAGAGPDLGWAEAAREATAAAEATAALRPRKGRARPLAEKAWEPQIPVPPRLR